jgi:uridylate kinase
MTETGRRRVLLKLSGEAFGGGALGVNPDIVSSLAREIARAAEDVEVAIVVGGGNFFRGAELSQRGMDRGRADYMGMLGTVMNALALQDFLEQAGAETRVQSAISPAICSTVGPSMPWPAPPANASPESFSRTRGQAGSVNYRSRSTRSARPTRRRAAG